MKRYLRHLVLLKITLLSLTGAALAGQMSGVLERMSLGSAWLCLIFFCATLLVGPRQVIEGGKPQTNNLLRRDLGIWTAITGLVHFWLGTMLSMDREGYMARFVIDEVRDGWFFWGSVWGFVAGILCLVLLGVSNNKSLKRFGAKWWKRIQRLAYPTFILTVIHGVYFQLLEDRPVWLWAMLLCSGIVVTGQLIAIGKQRQRVKG